LAKTLSHNESGAELESLVRKIEASLAGGSFTVEGRERVVEDGLVVAEFDIVLRGNVGSLPAKYLWPSLVETHRWLPSNIEPQFVSGEFDRIARANVSILVARHSVYGPNKARLRFTTAWQPRGLSSFDDALENDPAVAGF